MSETVQAVSVTDRGVQYQHTWLATIAKTNHVTKTQVGISKLKRCVNIGRHCREVRFVILVLCPDNRKMSNPLKVGIEVARTFATLFSDIQFHQDLLEARTSREIHEVLIVERHLMTHKPALSVVTRPNFIRSMSRSGDKYRHIVDTLTNEFKISDVFKGMFYDFKNRLPFYKSDWTDAFKSQQGLNRVLSAAVFVFFACLLPSIAFGNTNAGTTDDWLNVEKTIYAQAIGGLIYSVFSTQPLVLLLTTAPIALYIKIIKIICQNWKISFIPFYSCVGLWNSFFLLIYAITNSSRIMSFSTRACEEIFAVFTAYAFISDAWKHIDKAFVKYYHTDLTSFEFNGTVAVPIQECSRDKAILWLFLAIGTFLLGLGLHNFRKSPYLNHFAREFLYDYSLATSVIIMSFIGTLVFSAVKFTPFYLNPDGESFIFQVIQVNETCTMNENSVVDVGNSCLRYTDVCLACGLGFCMSLLFFLDQGFGQALTNTTAHKLRKPVGYHFDLFLVGIINGGLSLVGLPWIHGALPHSPMHVRALSTMEERVDDGFITEEIIKVEEQRVSAFLSHILILVSVYFVDYFTFIPKPVLDGLFLFVAFTSLFGNQLFERCALLITDRAAYPPSHYLRRVPISTVHLFTFIQLFQLVIIIIVASGTLGINLKLIFPLLIFLLIVIRQKLLPKLFRKEHLKALDAH